MRGELTAALLHAPEILFLDEPTIGLDVVSKQAVRAFLTELGRSGDTTVVLTTHDLADIERLSRRLVVIECHDRDPDVGTATMCGRTQWELLRYKADQPITINCLR